VRGRDVESRELAIEFSKESCRWRILGMATEVHLSDQRGRVLLALEDADEGLTIAEIVVAAQLRNRNAADILLLKMTKAGEIERVGRGVYGLPGTGAKFGAKNTGKIGKKERKKDRTVKLLSLLGKSQIFPIFPIFLVTRRTGSTEFVSCQREMPLVALYYVQGISTISGMLGVVILFVILSAASLHAKLSGRPF
jgi:hypothetical protein